MASSIRRPTARERAIKVMMFNEKPIAYIKMNPPNNEFGKARPVMKVDFAEPKKKNTTTIQRMIPIKIVSLTSATFKRIGTEPSRTIFASALIFFSFKKAFTIEICSCTRSATATVFAPDCL